MTSLGLVQKLIVYATSFWSMIPPEQCAWNQQWAAIAPRGSGERQVESGKYYEPVGLEGKLQYDAANDELAERLWEWTQRELEAYSL